MASRLRELTRFVPRGSLPVLLAVSTFALFSPFAARGIDAHHDAFMLKPALDLWAGQRLFVDTYFSGGLRRIHFAAGS